MKRFKDFLLEWGHDFDWVIKQWKDKKYTRGGENYASGDYLYYDASQMARHGAYGEVHVRAHPDFPDHHLNSVLRHVGVQGSFHKVKGKYYYKTGRNNYEPVDHNGVRGDKDWIKVKNEDINLREPGYQAQMKLKGGKLHNEGRTVKEPLLGRLHAVFKGHEWDSEEEARDHVWQHMHQENRAGQEGHYKPFPNPRQISKSVMFRQTDQGKWSITTPQQERETNFWKAARLKEMRNA